MKKKQQKIIKKIELIKNQLEKLDKEIALNCNNYKHCAECPYRTIDGLCLYNKLYDATKDLKSIF